MNFNSKIKFFLITALFTIFHFFILSPASANIIRSSDPASGAVNVSRSAVIRINLDAPCDAASVPANPLTNLNTGAVVPAVISFERANATIVLTPAARLAVNTNYKVELAGTTFGGGAQTLASPTSFTFTTITTTASASLQVSPSSISIGINQPIPATYTFTETAGQNIRITASTAYFLGSGGMVLANTSIPVYFLMPGESQTQYNDRVYIPASVKNTLTGNTLTYRRYFYGSDDSGNPVTLSADIAVTITSGLGAQFSVTKITIDTPLNGVLFKHHGSFASHAFIEGTGTGIVEGYWYIDDMPLDYINAKMTNGVTIQALTKNKLFTSNYGSHKFFIKTVSPNSIVSNSIFYTVSEISSEVPVLETPKNNSVIKKGKSPQNFIWQPVTNVLGYKIAVFKKIEDVNKAEWIFAANNHWMPSKDYWAKLKLGTYYWAVKSVNLDNQESPISDISRFNITEN